MRSFKLGIILGVGVLNLSFAAILIKLISGPGIIIAAGRLLVAALFLQPLLLKKYRVLKQEFKSVRWELIVIAGLILALHFGLWIESLNHTTIASSVVLVTTDPIFVALFSPLVLKEKPTLRIIGGIVLGILGTIFIVVPQAVSFKITLGNLLALGGAICTAGYLLIGRRVRQQVSLFTYIYIMYTTAAIALSLAVLLIKPDGFILSPQSLIFIILLGLGPQLVGHTCFNWALRYLTASQVAVVILGELVGSITLSTLILHEPPQLFEIIGGAVIVLGIYCAVSKR
jgi:drug/metabolite transporter (DMT)-like permease